jgi:putative membrane protein
MVEPAGPAHASRQEERTNPAEHRSASASLSDYLALERTILAWIRTGLALMGFGFVVARFGVFLEQFAAAQSLRPVHTQGLAIWGGVALIGAGVLVHLMAGFHYLRMLKSLDRGAVSGPHHSALASAVTFLLALVGLLLVIYLIVAQHFI